MSENMDNNKIESWAEHEVKLACKKENPDWDGKSFDYGCSIYQSALKGYNAIIEATEEDGHSGFSWMMLSEILNRLMHHRPLTSITDEDFYLTENSISEPEDYLKEHNLKSEIQCPRYSALFRHEHNDGTVTYTDVDRYFCFDVNDINNTYTGGGAAKILDELFPITMPYYPLNDRYAIACEDFLVDKDMGDFDTKAYWYITTPDNGKVEVNKFFKEIKDGEPITQMVEYEHFVPDGEPDDNGDIAMKLVKSEPKPHTYQPTKWVEISKEEFLERKEHKIDINNEKEAAKDS